jgi:Acetoacetate decarboxylase (ADC)
MVIPARSRGEEVKFVAQMYLNDAPPIAVGREICGFPEKYAHPTHEQPGELMAMVTMGHKHESKAGRLHLVPYVNTPMADLPAPDRQRHHLPTYDYNTQNLIAP